MSLLEQPFDGVPAANVAPGVDVVLPSALNTDDLFDERTRKLIGALHRRLWNRRSDMLQRRAQAGETSEVPTLREVVVDREAVRIADMDAATWDERLTELQRVIGAIEPGVGSIDSDGGIGVVAVRSWNETEAAVLVDGRAVPGCIFDVVTTVSSAADRFRNGEQPFVISIPEPRDEVELRLWDDLMTITEDRLGIDRGVLQAATSITGSASDVMPPAESDVA